MRLFLLIGAALVLVGCTKAARPASVYLPANQSADGKAHVATASTSAQDTQQHRQAIATGDKGAVIHCDYVVSMYGPGNGACEDNHGGKYWVMF